MAKKVEQRTRNFPIIGIGGSAGAFEAVKELIMHLSSHTGMAFIFLQHQPAQHESKLSKLLGQVAKIPVLDAEEGMPVEPDFFYVIPPGKELHVINNIFMAMPRPAEGYNHLPINRFFTALAESYGEYVVGVVLSGADSDGALGLKAIKAAGGLSFVQDSSALFQSMPKSAMAQGAVDMVLPPAEIAEELKSLAQQQTAYFDALEDLNGERISNQDPELLSILQMVHKATGVDFGQYKMSTIKRRIIRRLLLHKLNTLKEYLHFLREHNTEAHHLFNDLLINVTQFFRDPDLSEYLKAKLLPEIIKSKKHNEPIRIWVPACSTGQEVYSLAMLLVESMGEQYAHLPIQIFATDLSEVAINKARLGVYTKDEVTEVSAKRLQRFFTKIDGGYRIIKAIRDICVFATQNIAKDPPFSKLDIVSCCNLLIYIDNPLQKKIISTFHYSLNSNGYLILGKSETVGSSAYLFTQLDKKVKIYSKKKDSTAKALFDMSYQLPEGNKAAAARKPTPPQKLKSDEQDLEKAVDNLLLKKFTPASD